MQHGVRVVMEEPADVQVADEMGKICKMLVILVLLLFLCVGADGDAAVVFIYSLFCVLILVVVMTFCNAYYQGTSSTEEVTASVVAANAAVRGQQSLTGVMLGNDSQTHSASNNNNSSGIDAAGIAYGYGDNPRAVRLTLVIESDGRVRLAPMPVEQASAMQPLAAGVAGAANGEHVAGVPLASYPAQPGTPQGNTITNSNATATTRGANNNNNSSSSDGREGECRADGMEDGNKMSDDALYGRSAYIPSTGAGAEEMESVAVPVELSGSQYQGQQQQTAQQQEVVTPTSTRTEEEKERVGTTSKVAKDNAEV